MANPPSDQRVVRGFMCLVSWDFELGEASGGTTIFASLKDLKRRHPMWEECGVVEVETRLVSVVAPENTELMMKNARPFGGVPEHSHE